MELRPLESSDADQLYQLTNHNIEILLDAFPVTLEGTITPQATKASIQKYQDAFDERRLYVFGSFLSEELVGLFFIKSIDWKVGKAEIAYFIDLKNQGQGLATSGIQFLIEYAFNQLDLNKLYSRIDPENIPSIRVVEKNGFVKEGHLRQEYRVSTGKIIDLLYYGLLK